MRRTHFWLTLVIVLFALAVGGLQWWKWQQFGYNGFDLGIYAQTVWSLSQGHGFASSIHDPSYLGDHLELALVPIAGLYRLWAHPVLLLWIQTLTLALSGWLIFLLARRYVAPRWSLLATGLWLLHPFIYNPALYEFHALTLALPILLAAILAYDQKRWAWWAIWLGVACLIREDLPLVALSWAVLAAIDRAPKRWWIGVGLFSIAYFVVSHLIIAQANALGDYKYTAFVSWLGQTPLEMLTYPFRHPLLFLGHIFSPKNWGTTLGLLIGFGVLPIFRSRTLIPAGLSFAQLLTIGSSPNSVLHLHYVIPFIPFLAWSLLRAVRDGLDGTLLPRYNPEIVRLLTVVVAIIGPLYIHLMYGPGELPWKRPLYAEPTPARDLRAAVAHVGPTDRVITTFNLMSNLANREHLYSLNYLYLGRRQYTEVRYEPPTPVDMAVIDWRELYDYQFLYRETEFEGRNGEQRILDFLRANELQPAAQYGSVVVYERTNSPQVLITTSRPASSVIAERLQPAAASARALTDSVEVKISWDVPVVPTKPVSIQFQIHGADGQSITTTRLLGEGALPATQWRPGLSWETRYHLTLPPDFQPQGLSYTWLELNGRYHLDRLRSFHFIFNQAKVLGRGTLSL